jgi:hypothetical protein
MKHTTTEQLAEQVVQEVQQMSSEERAKLQEHLDKEFGGKTDCVIDYMVREGLALTVDNYLNLAYLGDKAVDDLQDEERMALEELLEDCRLVLSNVVH